MRFSPAVVEGTPRRPPLLIFRLQPLQHEGDSQLRVSLQAGNDLSRLLAVKPLQGFAHKDAGGGAEVLVQLVPVRVIRRHVFDLASVRVQDLAIEK